MAERSKAKNAKRSFAILKKPDLDSAWQVFSIPAIDLGEMKAAALFNESGNDWIVERVNVVAPSGEKLVLDFQKSYINPSGLKAFL
ncbi:unnamed protein product [Oikopleura dioica]|uniref:Uncharacterized protein n=1 Tax=Oikopleura dioica TaxID=34765 RepID=E4YYV0_OIKDI|nr:unnamed protein product [Oikopleura dioica]